LEQVGSICGLDRGHDSISNPDLPFWNRCILFAAISIVASILYPSPISLFGTGTFYSRTRFYIQPRPPFLEQVHSICGHLDRGLDSISKPDIPFWNRYVLFAATILYPTPTSLFGTGTFYLRSSRSWPRFYFQPRLPFLEQVRSIRGHLDCGDHPDAPLDLPLLAGDPPHHSNHAGICVEIEDMYIYIYTYMYTYVCMYICIHISKKV